MPDKFLSGIFFYLNCNIIWKKMNLYFKPLISLILLTSIGVENSSNPNGQNRPNIIFILFI